MNEAKVYIVRIWASAAQPAGFRAAVRAVDKDEARLFADASLLGGYFEAELAVGPAVGPAVGLAVGLAARVGASEAGPGRGPTGPQPSAALKG
jgi:hypothetical protein